MLDQGRGPSGTFGPRGETAVVSDGPLAAVLAGGAGRRLGGAKPTALLAGRPLISYPLAAARAAGFDVIVVAKVRSPLPPLDCEVVIEPDEPQHPLAGIVAAVQYAAGRDILAIACDMPFLTAELLALLAAQQRSAAVQADGVLQPLLARYAASDLPWLLAALSERTSAIAALEQIGAHALAIDHLPNPRRLCLNVNSADDLQRAEREFAAG